MVTGGALAGGVAGAAFGLIVLLLRRPNEITIRPQFPGAVVQQSRGIGAKLPRGVPIYLYHGLADSTVPPSHVDLYAREIPRAHLHRPPDRDHQLSNDLGEIADVIKMPTAAP